jgi:WD40 repeat protein
MLAEKANCGHEQRRFKKAMRAIMQEIVRVYRGHRGWINGLAWSPDGRRIVSASDDGTAHVWDLDTEEPLAIYRGHIGSVNVIVWSPNGDLIASGSSDKTVQVWEATTGEQQLSYQGHCSWIRSGLAWSPDGTQLASGAWDRTVQVWDARSGERWLTYERHAGIVCALAWSPDGRYLASAGGAPDRTVQVWQATTGKHWLTYRGHHDSVHGVAWSPDGRALASAGLQYEVLIWEVTTSKLLATPELGEAPIAWTPDGAYLISSRGNGDVELVDARTGMRVLSQSCWLDGKYNHVQGVACSPDGKLIAAGGADTTVQVWAIAEMEEAEQGIVVMPE